MGRLDRRLQIRIGAFSTYTVDELFVSLIKIVGTNVGESDTVVGGHLNGRVEVFNGLLFQELLASGRFIAFDVRHACGQEEAVRTRRKGAARRRGKDW